MLHGVQSLFGAPALAYALWFLLGSLWAVLLCEYRAFRRRQKLIAQIHALESELAVSSEEYFESAQAYRDVRSALLDILAAREPREHRPREVGDFASGRATIDKTRPIAAE
ncbi:MAG TPA: hypothetical protein VN723_02000 [Rhizomicrobium sp.]|jgi:hypothetical protein|nr:hypothetical protein [Rhizomicrobium sp.]